MAQDFRAIITGQADLSKAKQDFDSFKRLVEQPIKITIDASGFNTVWGNIQRQAQQAGVQTAQAYNKAFSKNLGGRSTADAKLGIVTGELQQSGVFKEPALKELRASKELYSSIAKELDSIENKGLKLRSISFDKSGSTFTAKAINDMNTLVTLTGYWKDEVRDADGSLKDSAGWKTAIQYTTDYTSAIKQAQSEADKLAQSFGKIQDSFNSGTFNSAFDANIKRMESNLATLSANAFNSENTKKAVDAATEYQRIMLEIQATLNGTAKNPLTDEQVVAKYQEAMAVLRQYGDVWKIVRIEQGETISQEQANKNADGVQAWCNRNSKALKKYGKELDEIQEKMRHTFDANEQKALQQQAQQVYKKAGADGLTGLSFADQVKKAFNKIGQFTWIYAVTSQIKQIPQEMVAEVMKIDESMTELRKVSTASASELKNYFDQATESASKYGQTINEVIDSTASWTRLGYDLKDASVLTDVTAELAQVGSGLNVSTATEGLQATIRGFGLAADEAKRVGDMINYVADTEPIDAVGIIEGLERSSAAMAEANNTLEETIGLITASTSVTQDATAAGTAWRTISMRIRGAKTELEAAGEDTSGMVESVSKLREQVLALSGVDILGADQKTFKSTTQIVGELAKVYKSMSDIDQASLLELLGGKRGGNVLAAALQNWDIVEDTIKGASTESVGSMDKQLEIYNQSIKASLNEFKVAFQELSVDLINSNTIKGIVDFGTTIIKIIDSLVEHIGVLGTAITGLGIGKIVSTAISGAKSVDIAADSVELLGTALETANASGGGLAGTLNGLTGVLGSLSTKAGGAGSALGSMFGSIGAFLSNPLTLGIGAAALAGIAIYKTYKKQQDDLAKQAADTTNSWNESRANIEDYQKRYDELNKQLGQENLTEAERIGIKQQLLDLQNEIVAKYGEQASGIDLVNGNLRTQLDLIGQISEKEAKRNIRDNSEAYQQSVDEMTKERTYSVRSGALFGGMYQRSLSPELQERFDKIYTDANFTKDGEMFKFTGNTSEFDKAVNDVLDGLETLKESASETDAEILQAAIDSATKASKKNAETLSKYQDDYKAYLQQSLYADGFGDELAEYSKRTQEYNKALLSGDSETIISARKNLEEYKGTVKEITDAHAEYGDFFNEVADSVDKTNETVFNFKDILDDGIADSTNNLSKYSNQIYKTINDIKKLGLDGVDIQAILGNPQDAMYGDLSQLAKLWNPDIDLSKSTDLQSVADFLMQMAYGADAFTDEVDLAKSSFDDFMKSASASIDTLDKVNAALVNGFKSGGLSARIDAETGALTGDVATILNAYKKELGDGNIDELFERTADGIIVNRDALRALQAEQENTTKAEFIKRIKEAQEHLAMATTDDERKAWQTRLDNVKLLASAYDGATSAYQKWVDAQNMGEAGDQYDTVASTAIKRGEELYNKGLVGTNEFRAIAQLYTDQDLALASIDEITEAYENGVSTVKKYFTEGQEGAVAFADKLVELGAATKEGDFYNFEDGINTSQIAEDLGISVDLVEAAFKKLGDYGFDIHFMDDEQLAEFDSLTEKAEEAQEKLKELRDSGAEVGDTDLIDIDLSEIDTVDEINTALEQLGDVVASPEIDPESAEAYQAIIDALKEKLDLLSQTDIGNEVNFSNLDSAYNLLGSLQGRIEAINSINATSTVDVDVNNDDQVQLLAEQIANLPPDIKMAIGVDGDDANTIIEKLKNEEIQIPVEYQQPTNAPTTAGTATVNIQYEQGDLPSVSSQTVHLDYEPNPIEANVVAKLDNTAVESYNPISKDADVVYGVDDTAPTNYQPSGKFATVTYTVDVVGEDEVYSLPGDDDRYITYHIETTGIIPFYRGTVPTSAFQGMAHVGGTAHAGGLSKYGLKQDENSLINELGAEIVVRPSEDSWMIFNDGMPTFAPLRKDDIIFNAEQTKELLEKGWTKNYASILGGAFASGTLKGSAHARKVTGGGSFKKATSSSKKSSGGGNGGGGSDGGGSSNSTQDANDFNEILDEIQINIDRIERDIKNLDTIASDTFTNLTGRTSALNKELVKVRKEIKAQQTGYSRYLAKANSVGLNGTWAERVRNGENLTLDNVGDENLWEKIQEYQKWWNSRHLIHLTAGKLRRHINYNARMKYA